MRPEHGDPPSPPQPLPFPLTIVKTPDLPTYSPGQQVLVSLRGIPDFLFNGFLIQARAPNSVTPVGVWSPGPYAVTIGCLEVQPDFSGNDTAAHQPGSPHRNHQELVWTAPSTPGTYRFELMTVERFGIYWIYQFTSFFNVV